MVMPKTGGAAAGPVAIEESANRNLNRLGNS